MKSNLLKAERIRRGWTQTRVAEAVGVDAKTVGRWERGITAPYPYFREQLCFLFEKTPEQLGLLSDDESSLLEHAASLGLQSLTPDKVAQSSFLADPSIPQPLKSASSLVGCQDLLIEVKERLLAGHNVALRAVDGLPGIGKTTLAAVVAMDQQVRDYFHDGILWAGLGAHPNVLGHLARWGMLLGVIPSQVENISSRAAWSRALRAAIGTRRLLLVISDAWTAEDALSLQIGGMACAHLVTTGFSEVAYAVDQKGGITIPQLEQTERIALLRHFIPELVEQDLQGAYMLVDAVGGLPLALTLMGSYLASQTFPAQLHPLHIALVRFYDTEARLRARMPRTPEELGGTMPLSLHTVIAMCDQQLSPQAHATLHALTVFPPKPESFSQEAALAVTQQPVETLDALCNAGLLEIWGPERYLLHQSVADYICAQGKVSAAQEQQTSILLEDDVQKAPTPNIHNLGHPLFLHLTLQDLRLRIQSVSKGRWSVSNPNRALQDLRLRMSNVSTFRPFKRFSSRSLLISSVILLTVLVIIAMLPVSNLFFLHNSTHWKANSTYAPPSYKLVIPSTEASLQDHAQYIQNAFSAVYPQLVNRFALDPGAAPKMIMLTLIHSSDPSSLISMSGTTIYVSPDWIQRFPSNIGLLTHELTLSVEQYPSGAPAWFSDGMADYTRSVYGPADDDNWSLPDTVQPTDTYTQGGKVAARFLLWLEQHTSLDIVDQLNHALQTRQSFSAVFHRLTHHTVDELWSQYQKDPDISLTSDQLYKTVTSRKPFYRSASLSIQASQPRSMGLSDDLGGLFLSNFALQADITILSGDGGGIIFRHDGNAQYRFHMALDGTFDLVDQTGIGPNGFSPAIREGLHQTNQVTIIAQKHTIYVYINGHLIVERVDGNSVYINGMHAGKMRDGPSNYGTVALMANDSNDPTEVRFENVQIF